MIALQVWPNKPWLKNLCLFLDLWRSAANSAFLRFLRLFAAKDFQWQVPSFEPFYVELRASVVEQALGTFAATQHHFFRRRSVAVSALRSLR